MANPVATPVRTTTYAVTVTDANGCADTDSVTVYISDIEIEKTAHPSVIRSGERVTYNYRITNIGDDPLTNVNLADSVPGLTFIRLADDPGNDDNVLGVGETWVYEATTTLTEDITNTATVTGTDSTGETISDQDTAYVEVIDPSIELVKTANPSVVCNGGQVAYTYEVTNSGDADLDNMVLTDDQLGVVTDLVSGDDGDGLLEPGETWVYQVTSIPEEDVTNVATVTGTDPTGRDVSDVDTAEVKVAHPNIEVTKTATPNIIRRGELVTYVYRVANTGDCPLDNVAVVDDQGLALTRLADDPDDDDALLEAGEVWIYEATTSLSEDTINTVTVQGTNPIGVTVQDQDTAEVAVFNPSIIIDKSADKSVIRPGETVVYTYLVNNDGDAPLSDISVSDDRLSSVTPRLKADGVHNVGDDNDNGLLDPGETWQFGAAVTLNTDATNTATATGKDPTGRSVSDKDTSQVNVINPSLEIYKTAHPTTVRSGESVTYTYRITNTGDDSLVNVDLTDSVSGLSFVRLADDPGNDDTILEVGETWVYEATATLTEDTTNTATVTAEDSIGETVTKQDTAYVDGINPSIAIEKTADLVPIFSGESVTYTYRVVNDGDVELTEVEVKDSEGLSLTRQADQPGNNDDLLEPGETWIYRATASPGSSVTNVGTATGADPTGRDVSDTDTADVTVTNPTIEIVKTADPPVICSGGQVTYTYEVSNLGDVDLTEVEVTDDQLGAINNLVSGDDGDGVLEPGETWVYQAAVSPEEDVANIATVTGTAPTGEVSDTDAAEVNVAHPNIGVNKTATPTIIRSGERVTYVYRVANIGDCPLDDVAVVDDQGLLLSRLADDPGDGDDLLEAGEVWTYEATTSLTEDTINTVTVQGTNPVGVTVQDQDTAEVDIVDPAIAIDKSADKSVIRTGDAVTYTYLVNNDGDAPLSDISVSDDRLFSVTPKLKADGVHNVGDADDNALLDLGETWVFEATVTLTADTTNTATATGTDPTNREVSAQDTAEVDVIDPGIDVAKTAVPDVIYSGESVTYIYRITNLGDDPLINVYVVDDQGFGLADLTRLADDPGNDDQVLDPEETWVYEVTATVFEDTTNIVTVTAKDSADEEVGGEDAAQVDVIDPGLIGIEKTPSSDAVYSGETVTYTYRVSNIGDDPLTNVIVTDNQGLDLIRQLPDVSGNNDNVLEVGEIWEYEAITSLTRDITNIATAIGTDPSNKDVSAQDSAEVDVIDPGIDVVKMAVPDVIYSGESVTYIYRITNTGDDPLINVNVVDDQGFGLADLTRLADDPGNDDDVLDPKETWLYENTTSLAVDTVNTATVIARDSAQNEVRGEDTAQVDVIDPGQLSVEKTASSDVVYYGDAVTYTYQVSNDGDVPLSEVSVYDDEISPVTLRLKDGVHNVGDDNDNSLLDPGEIWEYAATASLTENTVNIATATGTDPSRRKVFGEDDAEVEVNPLAPLEPLQDPPELTVNKTASRKVVERGEEVGFTIEIENVGGSDAHNVGVVDVFNRMDWDLVSISPTPEEMGVRSFNWSFDDIGEGQKVVISLVVNITEPQDFEFQMTQGIDGVGFVNVKNDYGTGYNPYTLRNCAYVSSDETLTVSDCAEVEVAGVVGTELSTREHGSGFYDNEERVQVLTKNKSIEMDKDIYANYQPTSLNLYRNRTVNYSSRWTEVARAKNRITGTSMHESYMHATEIDRDSFIKMDENESEMVVESQFQGVGHLGVLKLPDTNTTSFRTCNIFESREDYTGSFRVYEKVNEYGSNVESDKSASGEGFVSVDKRVGAGGCQRTYEYGTGSYQSEEQIRTHTNYIAKDVNLTYEPSNQILTDDRSVNQSLKWKEGMRSKTCSISLISEEYTGLDRLEKETVIRGLNEMETEVNFSGKARFRSVMVNKSDNLNPIVDLDEEYLGEYSIQRRVLYTGVPKYDHTHMTVTKEGQIFYLPEESLARYTITLENDGIRALGPIHVKDIFPPQVEFLNSSVRPFEITSSYSKWTLTHLSIGDPVTIELWLDVTEFRGDELVNCVEAVTNYNGTPLVAEDFHALEVDWLSCCPYEEIFVTKTGHVNLTEPNVVRYNLTLQSKADYTKAMRVVDTLPDGMRYLDSSVPPDSYESNVLTWVLLDVPPRGTVTILYRVEALSSGRFVNSALVEAFSPEGPATRPRYASAVVIVGEFEGQRTAPGWQPPDWGFEYTGYPAELTCQEICELTS